MSADTTFTSVERSCTPQTTRRSAFSWDIVLTVILLLIGAFVMIAPFAWIMQVAFSGSARAYQLPPLFFPSEFTFQNFVNVFQDVPYLNFIRNSFFVAAAITLGQLITCPMAAYPFARLNFPGKNVLFIVLLATLMIPVQVTIVPLFILMRQIGLYNTLWSVIFAAADQPVRGLPAAPVFHDHPNRTGRCRPHRRRELPHDFLADHHSRCRCPR